MAASKEHTEALLEASPGQVVFPVLTETTENMKHPSLLIQEQGELNEEFYFRLLTLRLTILSRVCVKHEVVAFQNRLVYASSRYALKRMMRYCVCFSFKNRTMTKFLLAATVAVGGNKH